MDNKWWAIIQQEKSKEYFKKLEKFITLEYQSKIICPPQDLIYRAFELTDFDDVKVVIIGQDPYFGLNQANGLAFAVNKSERIPQSLNNIFKELTTDLGLISPTHGDLGKWSKQGVLLLNTVLTVELNKPLSHQNLGWEIFTTEVIKILAKDIKPKVFVLWGNYAQKLESLIKTNNNNHLILKAPHPSPLSVYRGFYGSKPFSKINFYLTNNKLKPIDWKLD